MSTAALRGRVVYARYLAIGGLRQPVCLCRSAVDGTNVGQNIYWTASTAELGAVDWAGAVQDWYDEVAHRDGRLNTAAFK